MLLIYTDGACKGNPGPGGWAWARVDGPGASGGVTKTTNQRMELTAVWKALEAHIGVDGPITIVSDSQYVINGFMKKWVEGWKKNGWVNSQKKPVANRVLWEQIDELISQRKDPVHFKWVKGHSGDKMNDKVDSMAVAAVPQ